MRAMKTTTQLPAAGRSAARRNPRRGAGGVLRDRQRRNAVKKSRRPKTAAAFQRDVDATPAADYLAFRKAGAGMPDGAREAALADSPGLRRYDEAFEKVLSEVPKARVAKTPAVWLVYNMGVVVKTKRCTFAVDLAHRQGVRMAPLLDFLLVTHNHEDHWDRALAAEMDRAGKTVVSNFFDNYGAIRAGKAPGGYARGEKAFELGDVAVRATLSDHNRYLTDFTSAFEISVGDWTLYHTGDSQNLDKLAPTRTPDLWIVHPRCGLDVGEAVRKFRPRVTAVCHLCEMGHPPDKWRWTLADGCAEAAKAEAAGSRAVVPLWGGRIR